MDIDDKNNVLHKTSKETRLQEIIPTNVSRVDSNHSIVVLTSDKKKKKAEYSRRREQYIAFGHTRFEWVQLITTLTVPITLGIFTILNSFQQINQSQDQFDVQLRIAGENRQKDLKIAEVQMKIAEENRQNDIRISSQTRQNDLLIASENRQKDMEIAEENRRKDFKIAEENRRKDHQVAEDQQKHSIITEYNTFLSELLLKEGIHLNNTNHEAARFVVRFKTLIAFSQLDPKRKTLLFKSLYEGQLAGRLDGDMVIDLSSADLTDIDFASPRDQIVLTPPSSHPYYSMNFSCTNLKNASFNSISFFNVTFDKAMMDDIIMLSTLTTLISFTGTSLLRSKFLYSHHVNVNFSKSTLDEAQFDQYECDRCSFNSSSMIDIHIQNSKFVRSTFINAEMNGSFIRESEFSDHVNMMNVSLTNSKIHNSTFTDVDMRWCKIYGSSFLNSKFIKINFYQCQGMTDQQLREANIVSQSILPNGTIYSTT